MEDSAINLAIAKLEFPHQEGMHIASDGVTVYVPSEQGGKNYCQWWEDIGEIIEREGIGLKRDTNYWEAYRHCDDPSSFWIYYAHSDTPTKAAALCYLRMKGSDV